MCEGHRTALLPHCLESTWGLGHLTYRGVPWTCYTVGARVFNNSTPLTQVVVPNTRYNCFRVSYSKKDKNPSRAVMALGLCVRTLGKFYLHWVCKILVFSTTTHDWDSMDLNNHRHLTWFRHLLWLSGELPLTSWDLALRSGSWEPVPRLASQPCLSPGDPDNLASL